MAENNRSRSSEDVDFPRLMAQVETLVHELEQAPDPHLRERAQLLVRALLDLHKAGLARALEVIGQAAEAPRMLDELATDPLVSNILSLHDLHPIPLDVRVARAVERARARAEKHGADVAIALNGDGRAVIRIVPGAGCGSSLDTIRAMVEESLYADAPDLSQLEFEAVDRAPVQSFIPLGHVKRQRDAATADSPTAGTVIALSR